MTSYYLHHHLLDPASRTVRLTMAEKGLVAEFISEVPWAPSAELLALNPAGDVPALVCDLGTEKHILADASAICEYLDETQAAPTMLGRDPAERAEVRRLVAWFHHKFQREVTALLLQEKLYKRQQSKGEPDSLMIRTACHNIRGHLDYIGWLAERRNWLAGPSMSIADLAAAAQLSVVDYFGNVPWDTHP